MPSKTFLQRLGLHTPTLPVNQDSDQSQCLANQETAALAERVGVLQQHWQQNVHRWDDARYERNKAKLLYRLAQLEAALAAEGTTLADYGWAFTRSGVWHRIGEPPSENMPARSWQLVHEAYEKLGQRIPAGALDWAEAKRPEVALAIDRAEAKWSAAYERKDSRAFKRGLSDLVAAGDVLAAAYENRDDNTVPEEGQAPLFDSDIGDGLRAWDL